jgi:hypothetical protein
VPIARDTLIRTVLAKRWNDDAVGEGEATKRDRREEFACHGGGTYRAMLV